MTNLYSLWADLIEYPNQNWPDQLEQCKKLLAAETPQLAALFDSFYQSVRSLSLSQMQERYTQTFDLNPVCTLEIGYHLFGESYKRGLFMANLRETESPYDLKGEFQLPDYLPVLLRLIDNLRDLELRYALITDCLIPAVGKIREALAKSESIYQSPLTVIAELLNAEDEWSGEFFCNVNDRRVIHV